MCSFVFVFFFFKQKTAYEMRISDWSSDVCSSDLAHKFGSQDQALDALVAAVDFLRIAGQPDRLDHGALPQRLPGALTFRSLIVMTLSPSARTFPAESRTSTKSAAAAFAAASAAGSHSDRKSVVEGKSVLVRVDLGGGRIIKKKKKQKNINGQNINKRSKNTRQTVLRQRL